MSRRPPAASCCSISSSREEAHHMLTTPVQLVLGTRTRGTRVSSSPSKIPYGEFSPVRLQTGIQPRPSPTRSASNRHPAPAYTRLKSRSRERATSRCRPFSQSELSPSDRTLPSRGPWLASGFCCPARSTLTMTSSETLDPSRRLMFSPSGVPRSRGSPIYSACPFPPCRLPYPGRPDDCTWLFLHRPLWPSPSQ